MSTGDYAAGDAARVLRGSLRQCELWAKSYGALATLSEKYPHLSGLADEAESRFEANARVAHKHLPLLSASEAASFQHQLTVAEQNFASLHKPHGNEGPPYKGRKD
jgi:hypothetical protein